MIDLCKKLSMFCRLWSDWSQSVDSLQWARRQ